MNTKNLKGVALAAAVAGLGLAATTSVGASASTDSAAAGHSKAKKVATITAFANRKEMNFAGPKTVKAGSELRIVSETNPKKVGPHTFTLIKKKDLPKGKQEMKKCERIQSKVCEDIVIAHEANPKTGEVNKPDVDVGKTGWDKSFGSTGDTWFTDKKGESTERIVSAKAGTTLHYFCVVHPFMEGKIKVK